MSLFPYTEHKLYNFSFLLNTFTTLRYNKDKIVYDSSLSSRLEELLTNSFLVSCNAKFPEDSISLKDNEAGVDVFLNCEYAQIRVGNKRYKTFGFSVLPEASKLKLFVFGVLKLNYIDQIEVRKISLFPIQTSELIDDNNKVEKALQTVLSKELLSLNVTEYKNNINGSVSPFRCYMMEDKEHHYQYKILVGILKNNKSSLSSSYNIIIDSTCVFCRENNIQENEVDQLQIKMNKSLYDLFHWAVKKDIIELMSKENNDDQK